MTPGRTLSSSFRDPSGFVFEKDGAVYRQVNRVYAEHYDLLMSTGLYQELAGKGLLVAHEETDSGLGSGPDAYKVIKPARVPFISYPYEWCFSQLKDAALNMLEIQKAALDRGMSLKDASAYNMQFIGGKAALIDTLSFERYAEGRPWTAYRQFCEFFLAPLCLLCLRDARLGKLLSCLIEGIPLDLACSLLPLSTRLRPFLLTHLHLHARCQRAYRSKGIAEKSADFSRNAFLGLIDSLATGIEGLRWSPAGSAWEDYDAEACGSEIALKSKTGAVAELLADGAPSLVLDLGANTGRYSRLAAEKAAFVVSADMDHSAVERHYRRCVSDGSKNILPLVLDLFNPSPSIGWDNAERTSWTGRMPVGTVMALALVHHLAISNNVPLPDIAAYFSRICGRLIVEFVPKTDPRVQRLLRNRRDPFAGYSSEAFEAAFSMFFEKEKKVPLAGSGRAVYLMRRRQDAPQAGA